MKGIDINCDIAELDYIDDLAFFPYISSVNICCGEHAGNPDKINDAIRNAIRFDLKIGAHPSYPDRENFGRKSMDISIQDLTESLFEQILYIKLLVEYEGKQLHHVKAHGALYNDLFHKEDVLNCFLDVVQAIDPSLKIYALAHTQLTTKIEARGMKVVREAFMDRRYTKELHLAQRSLPGAVFSSMDEVKEQLKLMLDGKIMTELKDTYDKFEFDTICLHSDTPGAQDWIRDIYDFIQSQGYEIT